MCLLGGDLQKITTVGFDADDTLWHNERFFRLSQDSFAELIGEFAEPDHLNERLLAAEKRNLLRYGGMRPDRDVLQFDCALSYGLVEYLRTLRLLPDYGFSTRNVIPHGGHQLSLNIAAGLHLGGNESYPEVFAPFGGFADNVRVENGRVGLPDVPGIGFEAKSALIRTMRAATETG